jgi:hypothetical protein
VGIYGYNIMPPDVEIVNDAPQIDQREVLTRRSVYIWANKSFH